MQLKVSKKVPIDIAFHVTVGINIYTICLNFVVKCHVMWQGSGSFKRDLQLPQ